MSWLEAIKHQIIIYLKNGQYTEATDLTKSLAEIAAKR